MLWHNGCFTSSERLELAHRAVCLRWGFGFFTTLAFHNGQALFFEDHWARLSKSSAVLQLPLRWERSECHRAMEKIALTLPSERRMAMRLSVYGRTEARGLTVKEDTGQSDMLIEGFSCDIPDRVRLAFSPYGNRHTGLLTQIKSSNLLVQAMAECDVRRLGADMAFLCNEKGRIAGATRGNIYVLCQGEDLVTPPLSEGALEGVMRKQVMVKATACGIRLREAPLCKSDLAGKPLWVSNALIGLCPAVLHEGADQTLHWSALWEGPFLPRAAEDYLS